MNRTGTIRSVEAVLLAALLASLGSLACGDAQPPDSANPAVSSGPVDGDPSGASAMERVTTSLVRRGAITALVTASGSIAACRSTALGPAVPGRIVRVFVDVGDEVAEGDPIFLIDEEPYRIALEEAEHVGQRRSGRRRTDQPVVHASRLVDRIRLRRDDDQHGDECQHELANG